jgi:hypothetical protein
MGLSIQRGFTYLIGLGKCMGFGLGIGLLFGYHYFPSSKLTWHHFRKMEEVLKGYVTNPNPTLTLTSTLTLTPTELIKKSKKKRLYKISRAVCWMEKSANLLYRIVWNTVQYRIVIEIWMFWSCCCCINHDNCE